MKEYQKLIICTLLSIMWTLCVFLLVFIITTPKTNINDTIEPIIMTNITIQTEQTLKSYVIETVKETKQIFKYNITPDNINQTDEELLTRGGDCLDWSRYYLAHLPKEYTGRIIDFPITQNPDGGWNGHAFLLVWDKQGNYCTIDQTTYRCNNEN